jgi:hypothetical protein
VRIRAAIGFIIILACGCAGGAGSAESAGDMVETGRNCAHAAAHCGGGRCVVEVDNQCDTPVTCQLHVESLCQTNGGDVGPANASTKKVTQLAGTKQSLEVQANCEGTFLSTKVTSLECI